eukprot:Opistho-2@9971
MKSGVKRKDVRTVTSVLLDGKGDGHVEDLPVEETKASGEAHPHPHTHKSVVTGCCAHEIPEYYRQRFILSGYRAPTGSLLTTAKTLFAIHNETVNIWSHFLSALIALVMYATTLRSLWSDGASIDRIAAFTVFFSLCERLLCVQQPLPPVQLLLVPRLSQGHDPRLSWHLRPHYGRVHQRAPLCILLLSTLPHPLPSRHLHPLHRRNRDGRHAQI